MNFIGDETDPITPTIEHHVDEILDARGRRVQVYNYIDYHFETGNAYVRARTYMEKPTVAEIYGPVMHRGSMTPTPSTELLEAAKAYLSRRFNRVRTGVHP